MKVCIRADASVAIGSGHVMRCLTLAEFLREKGVEVSFICRELPGNYSGVVEKKGFKVCRLPAATGAGERGDHKDRRAISWETDAMQCELLLATAQPDWLIVDHYDLDVRWEQRMRPLVKKIMVIDDLADRPHDCDLFMDQNLCDNYLNRYHGLLPGPTVKLLGAQYALLREEFFQAGQHRCQRGNAIKRLLLFFGGSDFSNETSKALKAIALLDRPDIAVDVVLGEGNPYKEQVVEFCLNLPQVQCHRQVNNMAKLMSSADLALGAGGGTTWERLFLQLKSIVIAVAENQVAVMEYLGAQGYIKYLGKSRDVGVRDIAAALTTAIEQGLELKNYEFDNWRSVLWEQLQGCSKH